MPATLGALIGGKRGAIAWSGKIAARCLEAYAVGAEAAVVPDALTAQSLALAATLAAQYEPSGEPVQIRLIDLCIRMLRARVSAEVLRKGAEPMVSFLNNCPGYAQCASHANAAPLTVSHASSQTHAPNEPHHTSQHGELRTQTEETMHCH